MYQEYQIYKEGVQLLRDGKHMGNMYQPLMAYLFIIVDMVRVSDAHEENVRRHAW